ncbi:adenosine deaminase [Dongia sedimenti]|uniref:Adenine deaminase n=1 Tax=Dongia sedimenti TaxID=3064282 RepID=A0ABU0YTD4_9PROT|nr:adenosine deaminase [Rhodospirillaceae bacterium R-7]
MSDSTLARFIRGLPKAELHIHIEGSLEPELMFRLATKNGVTLPYRSVEEVRQAYNFDSLQSFLDLYYMAAGVLLHRADFAALTEAYFDRLVADGGVYAEIFFDPQTHTDRGIALGEALGGVLDGMARAEARHGIKSKVILCCLRHLGEAEGLRMLAEAEPFLDRVVGLGLDSSERDFPPADFKRLYDAARAKGLRLVAHAGEEGPAAFVRDALDVLKVERIDHGIRAIDDPALVARLARAGTTLTVCPLSNVRLCTVNSLSDHPLRRLHEAGVKVTINSDDPAYFGGYLHENYLQTAQALNLTEPELAEIAGNSFRGAFLTDDEKAGYLQRITAYVRDAAF